MITQRFRPLLWVAGATVATTSLYLISLQVASEHKKLDAINLKILATQNEVAQLNTQFVTRASQRQLEQWNGATLALTAPRARQYLRDASQLDRFDPASLNNKADVPTAAMAQVTFDPHAIAAQPASAAKPTRVAANAPVTITQALAAATEARPKR